jgi:hypothetical protein
MAETRYADAMEAGVMRRLRRLAARPGLVDGGAARQRFARTTGWAMRRIAKVGELAGRHRPAEHGGAAAAMLLARMPAGASGEDAAGVSAAAPIAATIATNNGALDRQFASDHIQQLSDSIPQAHPPSGLALRPQRRALGPGLPALALGSRVMRFSVVVQQAELHQRLGARTAATPQIAPRAAQLARSDAQDTRGVAKTSHNGAAAAVAAIEGGAARRAAGVDRAVAAGEKRPAEMPQHGAPDAAAPQSRIESGAPACLGTSATDVTAPLRTRRDGRAELAPKQATSHAATNADLPVVRVEAALPRPSASRVAQLGRSGERGITAPAGAPAVDSGAARHVATVDRSVTVQTSTAIDVVARLPTSHRRKPDLIAAPAMTREALSNDAAPELAVSRPASKHHDGMPLVPERAISNDVRAPLIGASGAHQTREGASAASMVTHVLRRSQSPMSDPAPRIRAAAASSAAAAAGGLIWRLAENSGRDHDGSAAHPAAEVRPMATTEIEPLQTAFSGRPDASPCAPPQPVPDMNRLVDEVMRQVVRRIHVERERRGGKLWS